MRRSPNRDLLLVLLIFGAASLIHFVHNAEFVADYPNLPSTWSRADVYFAWIGMTILGWIGWLLVTHGIRIAGLALLTVYAMLGLESLGHYLLAPLSQHTFGMNATILFEVNAAALVLVEVMRQFRRPRRD